MSPSPTQLTIHNLIDTEVDELHDDECYDEIMSDVRSIVEAALGEGQGHIECTNGTDDTAFKIHVPRAEGEAQIGKVFVTLNNYQDSLTVINNLNGKLISGKVLTVNRHSTNPDINNDATDDEETDSFFTVRITNLVGQDNIDDDDEREEVLQVSHSASLASYSEC